MKDWFIYIRQNIFNHEGRARRSEFVWFQIMNVLSQIVFLSILIGIILITFPSNLYLNSEPYAYFVVGVLSLLFIYQLWMFLVYLGVTTRRLHDLGWSGWWQLVIILPTIGISLFMMMTQMEIGRKGEPIYLSLIALCVIFACVIFGILFFKEGKIGENQYGEDPKVKERALVNSSDEYSVEKNNENS